MRVKSFTLLLLLSLFFSLACVIAVATEAAAAQQRIHVLMLSLPLHGHVNSLYELGLSLVRTGKYKISFAMYDEWLQNKKAAASFASVAKLDNATRSFVNLISLGEMPISEKEIDSMQKDIAESSNIVEHMSKLVDALKIVRKLDGDRARELGVLDASFGLDLVIGDMMSFSAYDIATELRIPVAIHTPGLYR